MSRLPLNQVIVIIIPKENIELEGFGIHMHPYNLKSEIWDLDKTNPWDLFMAKEQAQW